MNRNVIIVCLTVIVVACIASIMWISLSGQDAPVALTALGAVLGAAVPALINGLQVAEVKHQTNGNTSRLVDLVETLSVPNPAGAERHPRAPGERPVDFAPPEPPG